MTRFSPKARILIYVFLIIVSFFVRLFPSVYDDARELFRDVKNSEHSGLTGKVRLAVSLLAPLVERSLKKAKEMTDLEREFGH